MKIEHFFKLFYIFIVATLLLSGCSLLKGCSSNQNNVKTDNIKPVFIKFPWLIYDAVPESMLVLWQTNSKKPSSITFGTNKNYTNKIIKVYPDSFDNMFKYRFTGLKTKTKYFYKIVTGNSIATGSFTSAPDKNSTNLEFIVYGDTRTNIDSHNKLCSLMNQKINKNPALQTVAIHVGDFVEDGDSISSWENEWFSSKANNIRKFMSRIPIEACLGNHEDSGELFDRYFPYPFKYGHYWSFNYGPAHFVFLDQYVDISDNSKQINWLKNDLKTSTKKWNFIVFHEPGYSANGGHSDNDNVRTVIQPVLEEFNVTAVFSGHNHYYSRAVINGVTHITTGGGGAPLYNPMPAQGNLIVTKKAYHFCIVKINNNTLSFKAIDINNRIIDNFIIN